MSALMSSFSRAVALLFGLLLLCDANASASGFQQLVRPRFNVAGDVRDAAILENGQTILGGDFETVNGIRQPHLARLNADGTLDSSWQPQVPFVVYRIIPSGGYLYLMGNETSELRRVPLNGDGAVDPEWTAVIEPERFLSFQTGVDLAVSDGFVYYLSVRTFFTASFKLKQRLLMKRFFAANGELDQSWGEKVVQAFKGFGNVGKIQVDGSHVYVAHSEFNFVQTPPTYLKRYSVFGSGKLDRSWSKAIKSGSFGGVAEISQDADFLYFAGSDMRLSNSGPPTGIGRISKSRPAIDPTWPSTTAREGMRYCYDVEVDAGYAYVTAGSELSKFATDDASAAAQGSEKLVVPTGSIAYDRVAVGGQSAAVFVSSSTFSSELDVIRSFDRRSIALNSAFEPKIFKEGIITKVVRLDNGGSIVAGRFTAVDGLAITNLARFLPDGTLDRFWRPNPTSVDLPVRDFGVSDDSVIVEIGTALEKYDLAGTGARDLFWNPLAALGGTVLQAEFTNAEVFFTASFGSAAVTLFRASLYGTGAPSGSLEIGSDAQLLLDDQFLYASFATGEIGRLFLEDGTVDTLWGLQGEPAVALASQDNFVYVATASGIKRYQRSGLGAIDASWNPVLNLGTEESPLAISSLTFAGDWLYVGMHPKDPSQNSQSDQSTFAYLQRIGANGVVDSAFRPKVPFVRVLDSIGNVDETLSGPKWVGEISGAPVLGGVFQQVDGAFASPPAVLSNLPSPILTRTGRQIFVTVPADTAALVNSLRILSVVGGTLSSDGDVLNDGDVVPVTAGARGFTFTPNPSHVGGRFISIASTFEGVGVSTESVGATIDVTNVDGDPVDERSRFQMAVDAITVKENAGTAVVTVRKTGPNAGDVTVAIENGVARAGKDFDVPQILTVSFPAGATGGTISIPLRSDLVFTGNRDFRVMLTTASGDGIINGLTSTTVTIEDDDPLGTTDSLTTRPAMPSLPSANATLTAQLNAPLGAWRLLGETSWHSSGQIVRGLTAGNYFVEFRSVNGFIAPSDRTIPVAAGEAAVVVAEYTPLDTTGTGSFLVNIEPATVANGIGDERGQWRIIGETQWRDSGARIDDLPVGSYEIEFKTVPGRTTPSPLTVNVAGSVLYSVTGTYLIESPATGTAPVPLGFATVQSEPYQFVGAVHTPLGFASGTAVTSRVVLTVAHALFDDVTLSSVTDARWFHQKARRDYEPPPQVPRGWYIFQGYSAQRTIDTTTGSGAVGVSTPESQELDIAAMWFTAPCARGSFSGYLRTDAANEWLGSPNRKILAGYPVIGVAEESRGVMHATDPNAASAFIKTAADKAVRATDTLRGFPGMSGGPLMVEQDGKFYPAGVFLGGTAQTLVRVIDSEAVDLINRAETSGGGGANNVGGGITLVAPGVTASSFAPTMVGCELGPAGAVAQGGAWRVVGEREFRKSGSRVPMSKGTYRVEFKPVPGFATPPSQPVTLVEGQIATVLGQYLPSTWVEISITPANAGTAPSGDYALNREASITAKPAPGFIFSEWRNEQGTVISNSATIKLLITGPRNLVAAFVPGSFLTYGGTYSGFRVGQKGTDGSVIINVTKDGAFTGQVTVEGQVFRLKGQFDEDGFYAGSLGKFHINLVLDRSSSTGVVRGTIFDGPNPSTLQATQSPFSKTNPTSLAGTYTLVLPSADRTDLSVPPGAGGASVTIVESGSVRFAGNLADGTAVSGGSFVIDGNVLPIFAGFKSTQRLSGILNFTGAAAGSTASGSVTWDKDPVADDELYPAGFSTTLAARMSPYSAPPLDQTVASLSGYGGGLDSEFTRELSFNGKFVGSDGAGSSVTINQKTGRISGSVLFSGQKLTIGGVVDQQTGKAFGFFVGREAVAGGIEIVPGK
jgi:hypothetical protein